jgi:hypothetical protein
MCLSIEGDIELPGPEKRLHKPRQT